MAAVDDKVVLVTGATNGIGKESARALAAMGATVIIAGRNAARVAAPAAEVTAQTGNPKVESAVADLSQRAQVRALAAGIMARHARLDVLLNNAGAIFMQREVSADGAEMTWALNHLNYFILTGELLELPKPARRPASSTCRRPCMRGPGSISRMCSTRGGIAV